MKDFITIVILAFVGWLLVGAWREVSLKKMMAARDQRIEDSLVRLYQFAKKVEQHAYAEGDTRLHALAAQVILDTRNALNPHIVEL